MAFTQSRCQIGVLRGPKGRQAPLNGSTMAGAEVKGRQLIAGKGGRGGGGRRGGDRLAGMGSATGSRLHRSNHLVIRAVAALYAMACT